MSGKNARAKSQTLLYFASVDNCTQNVTNSVNRQNWETISRRVLVVKRCHLENCFKVKGQQKSNYKNVLDIKTQHSFGLIERKC
jgi:hypothetical protein